MDYRQFGNARFFIDAIPDPEVRKACEDIWVESLRRYNNARVSIEFQRLCPSLSSSHTIFFFLQSPNEFPRTIQLFTPAVEADSTTPMEVDSTVDDDWGPVLVSLYYHASFSLTEYLQIQAEVYALGNENELVEANGQNHRVLEVQSGGEDRTATLWYKMVLEGVGIWWEPHANVRDLAIIQRFNEQNGINPEDYPGGGEQALDWGGVWV